MSKPVRALVLLLSVLIMVGAVLYHKEFLEFFESMVPSKMEATITFGRAVDPSGQYVLEPTTTFQLGDNVAWVVRFQDQARAKELIVALYQISPEGREIPLDRNKMVLEPTDIGLYNFTTARAFWSLSPKGLSTERRTYRVKYLKKKVVAQGDFTIIDKSEDAPPPADP
jgi:hypothetical protein